MKQQWQPEKHEGATVYLYTDAHAYTVLHATEKRAKIQRDRATLLNGPNSGEPDALKSYPGGFAAHVEGIQRWSYSPNPKGEVQTISKRKDGKWYLAGTKLRVVPGRHEHYDYNF